MNEHHRGFLGISDSFGNYGSSVLRRNGLSDERLNIRHPMLDFFVG
jgi:hypothetical protein